MRVRRRPAVQPRAGRHPRHEDRSPRHSRPDDRRARAPVRRGAAMRLSGAAVLLLALVALSGCGSTTLSSGELENQATRVCALASRQTDRIRSPASPAGSEVFLRQGIAVLTPALVQLRKLHPPSDVADVYTAS